MDEEPTDSATEVAPSGLIDDLTPVSPPTEISLWWYVGPLIAVLLIFAIVWRTRKKIRAKYANLMAPSPPDHAKEARAAISRLRFTMQNLTTRQFLEKLSSIFRTYVEGRSEIRATAQTTNEFLKVAAESNRFDTETREQIWQFLGTTDLAKFAHLTVPDEDRSEYLSYVATFIDWMEQQQSAKAPKT
tara:strand:- start:72 stop:635 length:564 start_codon:yes stop_codon:yes gene_type:complete